MIESNVTIINKLGLHARAASKFVATASSFSSSIKVVFNDKVADGKSIMSVMLLAAGQGSNLQLICDGKDEDRALTAITELIANRFGEAE